ADASLFVGTEEVGYVAYTAVAPNRSDLAHLYAAPDVRQSKGVTSYYLSLVMERAAWHAGEFTAPVGGRVRFTLKDGRTYSANGVGLNIRLSLKGAGALSTDTESILRGTMEIVIPAELSGQEPLRVKSQINTP
ncbi:MAG: hypothetical protein RLZZ450_4116, partial [Pseudomonadota bacterium]